MNYFKSCYNSVINIVLIMCHCKASITLCLTVLRKCLVIFGLCNLNKLLTQAMNHFETFVIELPIFI